MPCLIHSVGRGQPLLAGACLGCARSSDAGSLATFLGSRQHPGGAWNPSGREKKMRHSALGCGKLTSINSKAVNMGDRLQPHSAWLSAVRAFKACQGQSLSAAQTLTT